MGCVIESGIFPIHICWFLSPACTCAVHCQQISQLKHSYACISSDFSPPQQFGQAPSRKSADWHHDVLI